MMVSGHDSTNLTSVQDSILDAAEHLFAKDGFEATSMRDVAQAAGVNVATLYYHCGSKQEIFALIYARVVKRMAAFVSETFASGGELQEVVGRVIDRVVEFFSTHRSIPRLFERAHLGEIPDGRLGPSGYPALLETVAIELRKQASLGKIGPVDPAAFVSAASGVIFHLIIDAPPSADVASLQAHARMFILGALGLGEKP
jgi:AcrR family transcriptional regulator